METRELRFRGRVQGVGFRYTALQVSEQFEITGWVRNLPDRSVQLCVEGEASEIDAFVEQLVSTVNSSYGQVDQVELVFRDEAEPKFTGFTIR